MSGTERILIAGSDRGPVEITVNDGPLSSERIYFNCLQGLSVWFDNETNRLRIERYEQLIRVMSNLSPHERQEHFNMQMWGETTACGTTMCAAGFCGMDAWFQAQGFKLVQRIENEVSSFIVEYKQDAGWYAIQEFFGILKDEIPQISPRHRVFMLPKTVDQVIEAAKERIDHLNGHKYY